MTVMTSCSSSTPSSLRISNWREKSLRLRMDLSSAAPTVNQQLALRTYFHWENIWKSFILKACYSLTRPLKFNRALWSIIQTSMRPPASTRARWLTAYASARQYLRRLPEQSYTSTLSKPVITPSLSAPIATFSWNARTAKSMPNRSVFQLLKASFSDKPWRRSFLLRSERKRPRLIRRRLLQLKCQMNGIKKRNWKKRKRRSSIWARLSNLKQLQLLRKFKKMTEFIRTHFIFGK